MATEKPYILPQGQQLTSEIITNLYLYNQPTTPTDEELLNSDLIRPILNISNIPDGAETISDIPQDIELVNAYVDAEPYMASGAGRFANGSQFDLVRAFFGLGKDQMLTDKGRDNLLEDVVLEPGTYTKEDLNIFLFQYDPVVQTKGLRGFSSSIELRNYRDTLNDYDELVYIWNSTAFSIPNNAQFVVNPDGTKEIRNFRIEPNAFPTLKNKENFDFETANPIVEIGSGLILEPRVDPSSIGRTVYIDFYNRGNLNIYDPVAENESAGVYNLIDFNADLVTERLFYEPNFFGVIEPVTREARKLFDAGVTEFLYKDKPIFYGTVDNDNLDAKDVNKTNFPFQINKSANGVVLAGGKGNDTLTGDVRRIGNSNDILVGHEGNDSLDGKGGEDVAIFSDNFENYDYAISEDKKTITISHIDGTQKDGTDTLRNIEWAEFGRERVETGTLVASSSLDGIPIATAPRLIPLPLTDGVESTEFVEVESTVANPNFNDPPTPPTISLTAPVAMLDGDVDYTLNISPYQPDTEYNVVYVIDTSISIDEVELQTIQDAYTDLTNFYINEGIAENINFGVVSYDSSGRFYTDSSGDINLTADEAIAALQNLTIDTRIGTRYYDGLNRADQFLLNSPKNPFTTTGIGYFITDGQNSGDRFDMLLKARDVRELANFQAIGYYTDLGNLTSNSLQIRDINWIDSNQGVFIDNLSDLSTELLKSDLADDIELVNILLDGEVVETITPDVFTDNPLGLTYEGSVDGLDVSIDAENIITAEVVFTNESNFATTNIDYTVTAGESEAVDGEGNDIAQSSDGNEDPFERMVDGSDSDDEITLGYADRGANGGAGNDEIIGNRRDNILDGGAGNDTISAYEGDDIITTGAGIDKVDGGSGIDTVIYNDVAYQGNNITLRKAGNSVSYNNTDTLTNVEFIQLSDVRFSTNTLEITPVVEVAELSITEGDSELTTAQLDFNLSTPAPIDVVFNYSTEDINATAGSDYTATSGTVTIPAGETSASINLEIIGDKQDEEDEQFGLNFSNLLGATFGNNLTNDAVGVTISDDDITLPDNAIAEYGTISNLSHTKQTIDLINTYTNPVVFV